MVNTRRAAPVAAATLPRLMDELASDRSTAKTVGDVVAMDPGLTAKVLAVANSAQFGLSRQVDRLPMAIQLIGTTTLQTLAIANAAMMFDVDDHLRPVRDHAFRVACASRLLAPWSGCGAAEAFAAGLLHDLGELLLWQAAPTEYAGIHGSWPSHELQVVAETDLYGTDHANVGADHLASWGVPRLLVEAVRNHGGEPVPSDLASIVSAAEALSDEHADLGPCLAVGVPEALVELLRSDLEAEVDATVPMLLAH